MITLRVVKALIEKTPKDLPLFASSVLNILEAVLCSEDLTIVEDSLLAFESFCQHHDGPALAASQDYLRRFETVTSLYARLAVKPSALPKTKAGATTMLGWRAVGLQAMRCIASSEALSLDGGRLLDIIIPIVLEHLYSEEAGYLRRLHQRAQAEEQVEREKELTRKLSTATAHPTDQNTDSATSPPAGDADEPAEEKINVFALHSLRQMFTATSRGHVRAATAAVLEFILSKTSGDFNKSYQAATAWRNESWAAELVEILARWTPVQDRFLILVTAMETLVRRPMTEEDVPQQLVLATLIGWLLRSDTNLIGLSIMDVLFDLMRHLLAVLAFAESHSAARSFHQDAEDETGVEAGEAFVTITSPRQELLSMLQRCIADLATHVYYSDQISDMLSAILLKIKPPSLSPAGRPAPATADPALPASAQPASATYRENSGAIEFFCSDAARIVALKIIREVLLVANTNKVGSASITSSRNRVWLDVWEGSQWLLRDHHGHVRKGYVDALLTWLQYEVGKGDVRAWEEKDIGPKSSKRAERIYSSSMALAQHLSPKHSYRNLIKPPKPRFMTLLHLALYDTAIERVDSESDVQLVHVLLASLVEKLGVTAVKCGLPMVFRMQEEMQQVENTIAKVRLGSIVHGYFWRLSEKFNFDTTVVGDEIQKEILRRKRNGLWMETIQIPPAGVERISTPERTTGTDTYAAEAIEVELLKPYDQREAMVDLIVGAFNASLVPSAPGSPSSSPSLRKASPILAPTVSSAPTTPSNRLPPDFRDELLSDWSREAIMANDQRENHSNSVSINGSKRGAHAPSSSGRDGFLAINGANGTMRMSNGAHFHHYHYQHHHHHHQQQQRSPPSPSTAGGGGGGGATMQTGGGGGGGGHGVVIGGTTTSMTLHKLQQQQISLHRGSAGGGGGGDGSSTPRSTSSRSSVLRVDDLKRVLSGAATTATASASSAPIGNHHHDDAGRVHRRGVGALGISAGGAGAGAPGAGGAGAGGASGGTRREEDVLVSILHS